MTGVRSILLATLVGGAVVAAVNRTDAVLSTLEQDYELTTFYNLFKSTGGNSGIPGPEFEERFNDNNNALNYTVLAPTDTAFQKIPESVLTSLTSVAGYPLLAALLRTHILPDTLLPSSLLNHKITAIEGFNITISQSGAITSNTDIPGNEVAVRPQAQLLLNTTGQPITVPASNGIIYKIDNIIDPLLTYFGESSPAADGQLPPIAYSYDKTMKDIVLDDNQLTHAAALLAKVDDEFLGQRLDLSYTGVRKGENNNTIWLAPSNEALQNFGDTAEESSNAEASRFFLESGFGKVQSQGVFVGRAGLTVKIDVNRVGNARVEKRTCGRNGCVWRIGRVLDLLYGA